MFLKTCGKELGRSLGGGNDNALQYSYLGNPMDRRAWWTTVHGVANSWAQLSMSYLKNCLQDV